jgi:hypothetical protein
MAVQAAGFHLGPLLAEGEVMTMFQKWFEQVLTMVSLAHV